MEQVFFAYADQKASDAFDIHLGVSSIPWTSELTSPWSRCVLGNCARRRKTSGRSAAWTIRRVTKQSAARVSLAAHSPTDFQLEGHPRRWGQTET
jgi:hypothetical protein